MRSRGNNGRSHPPLPRPRPRPILLNGREDICFTRSKVLDSLRPPGGKKERTTLILTQQSTVSSKPQRLLYAKPIISVERLPLSKAQQMSLIDPQKSLELWVLPIHPLRPVSRFSGRFPKLRVEKTRKDVVLLQHTETAGVLVAICGS